MPLFEATWPESASILISAHSTGEVLSYIKQSFGEQALYQLDELIEIKSSGFLLVRRCGKLITDLSSLHYRFCPDSQDRIFVVEKRKSSNKTHATCHRSVLVVDKETKELPALILWHYNILQEDECKNGELVYDMWLKNAQMFHIMEVDTHHSGILMSYEYCNCPPQTETAMFPAHRHKSESK